MSPVQLPAAAPVETHPGAVTWWESSPCPHLVLDRTATTVVAVNETFLRWSGLRRADVVGAVFARLLPVGDRILWSTHCLPKLEAAGRVDEISLQVVGGDRVRRAAFLTATRLAAGAVTGADPVALDGDGDGDGDGGPAAGEDRVLVALFGAAGRRRYEEDLLAATRRAEASEARRALAEQGLHHLAHHDPVTGLLNRRGLEAVLRSSLVPAVAVAAAPGGRGPAAAPVDLALGTTVLFLDLNGFKQVNDSIGHAGGDVLLTVVADRLRAALRHEAVVARFAGDEFVVVVALAGRSEVDALCRRLIAVLAEPVVVRGVEIVVSASIGVARCPDDPADRPADPAAAADALLHRADTAMYEAKRTRRSGWAVHDPAAADPAADRLRLLEQLRHAITAGQLRLHYQPRVDLADGRTTGVEALVRWQHPERGLLAPAAFIDVAEASGLVRELGAWVLETAVAQAAAWNRQGLRLQVGVNVSARQLVDPDLPGLVTASLARHGVPASQLVLEITETALVLEPETAAATLEQLSALGARVAVDDFGTGYASLTYLRRFPVHELKIDRSFVAGAAEDGGDAAIVAGCVQLAHALGLTSVAEGVETPEQLAVLQGLGCRLAQGYLLGRPVPPEELVLDRPLPAAAPTAPALPAPVRPASALPAPAQPAPALLP